MIINVLVRKLMVHLWRFRYT